MQEALIRLIDRVEEATEEEEEAEPARVTAEPPMPVTAGRPVEAAAPQAGAATAALATPAVAMPDPPAPARPEPARPEPTRPEPARPEPALPVLATTDVTPPAPDLDRRTAPVAAPAATKSRRPSVLAEPAPTLRTPIAAPVAKEPVAKEQVFGRLRGTATPAAPVTPAKVKPAGPANGLDAKAALAAERAREAARKVATARASTAPASRSADAASAQPARSPAQQGLRLALIAALLVPVSGAAFYLGDRYVGRGAAPRAAIEAPVGRPSSMPTEVVETPAPEGGAPGTEETAPVAPTTPANPQRRRVAPETVTDDFSQMSSGLPSAAALGAARPTQTAITGIVLDAGARLPSPTELARRVLPSPTANSSPNTTADEPAPRTTAAIPIAARPDDLNGSQSGEAETSVRNGVELPPPQIGPMSLRLAAQNGDPGAQFEVAARFADAKGVKQDFAQALIWYQRAAQKGFVPAQYRLATLLERGVAGGADLPRAKLWYKRAAEQGNTKAMHNLAVIATSENPQKPDYLTAARLFTDAAERGLADSQYNLAVLYDTGLGVGRDPMQAYKWYALAARSGDTDAAKRRDQVFAGLTPGQTRDAERSVEQFRAKFADPKANDPRAASAAWQAEQAQLRDRGERLAAEGRPRLDQAEASPNPAAPAPQPTAQRAQPKITTRPVPMPKPMP